MNCKEFKWYSKRSANVHWNHIIRLIKHLFLLYMYIFVKKTKHKQVGRIIALRYTCQFLT